ncbi:MAG: hypothetical protein H6739_21205 [Alphaproteobacteria bacterium]|nr:hypothetical protein [Alphaproteobacteria bacterium]
MTDPLHRTHREALRAAFKTLQALGLPALANRGQTQSAGWEDLAEASARMGLSETQGVFWHRQSNSAFGEDGVLLSTLWLHWKGDLDILCGALEEEGLDVVRPGSEDHAIEVKPTPLPGTEDLGPPPLARAYPAHIAAIRAAPRDRAPREVLLEAMQAANDPRAAFLELQMLYQTRGKLTKKQGKVLYDAHRRHERDFAGALMPYLAGHTNYCYERVTPLSAYARPDFDSKFRDGFVYSLTLSRFNADEDFSAPEWATVTELRVFGGGPWDALMATDIPARLEALGLPGGVAFTPEDAARFPNVTTLELAEAEQAPMAAWFPRLQAVRFFSADAPHGPMLEALPAHIDRVPVGGELIYHRVDDRWSLARTTRRFPSWGLHHRRLPEVVARLADGLERVEIGLTDLRDLDGNIALLQDALASSRPELAVNVRVYDARDHLREAITAGTSAAAAVKEAQAHFSMSELSAALHQLRSDPPPPTSYNELQKLYVRTIGPSIDD